MTRRLTITTGDGRHAEGAQFTNGIIVLFWVSDEPPQPEMWITADAIQQERPGWDITWIDDPREV